MISDVKVIIERQKPIGSDGFGFPLILATMSATTVEYTECTDIESVVLAGFDAESEVYKMASKIFVQTDAPRTIAVCGVEGTAVAELPAILDKGWRQLLVTSGSGDSTAAQLAAYIEATDNKLVFFNFADKTEASGLSEFDRAVCVVHGDPLAAAAIVGATAGKRAGSITYKNIIIAGVAPELISASELGGLHAAGCITIVSKAGDIVTSDGISASGEFIDIIDSRDYIITQLEYQTQKLLNQSDKIPFTNPGIAQLESVAVNVLRGAFNNGIIGLNDDGSPAYTVSYAVRAETTPEDRAERKYFGGRFSFELAGAVHTVTIRGEIII